MSSVHLSVKFKDIKMSIIINMTFTPQGYVYAITTNSVMNSKRAFPLLDQASVKPRSKGLSRLHGMALCDTDHQMLCKLLQTGT